jgi:photosystem II stability/assembly factor-like uncharacterized protein
MVGQPIKDDSVFADLACSSKGLSVIPHTMRCCRFGLGGLLAVAMLTLLAGDRLSQAEELSREQQIADLERQIQDLNKKLTELRKTEPVPTPTADAIPDEWIKTFKWRCIGPASMGGRIVGFSVYEADPCIYWIATASGGLLKTTNNGVTFEHQFDREATVSIGAVCVAPSDPNIVWVGTGENNPRNSVSYGDGVYKSTDGGKSWKNMGLKKSFQIGKILVHPKNPDIVYVGALGRLYGPSEERGLFKTTDGGKTWQKVLFIDDKTGIIDMRMSPADPETLLVASWEHLRDLYDSHRGEPPLENGYDAYDPVKKWGPGSGIHKTSDGGKTWHKLTKGLPSSHMGRIGLDFYAKDPKVVYAIIDCREIGKGTGPAGVYFGVQGDEKSQGGARLVEITPGSPAGKAGLKAGDVITLFDKKEIKDYKGLVDQVVAHKPDDKVEVTVLRAKETLKIAVTLAKRPAENAPSDRPSSFAYGGQRENMQDKQGPNSHEYGGVYRSADAGESWVRINSINPRPMYFSQVRVDPSDERYLYVTGIALYRSSDGGKTFKSDGANRVHPDQHALWIDPKDGRHMLVATDGGSYVTYDRMDHWDFLNHQAIGQFYHVAVDSKNPYRIYGGLQDNGTWGGPSMGLTGIGPINEDWVVVSGGDGFVARVDPQDADLVYFETQDGNMARRNLRTGERAQLRPREQKELSRFRFNWNTPFILSSHNPHIYYSAGNYVFRSLKQGSEGRVISPEIARTKRGTATALAESPRNPDVLWAGTDDGYLWVTRDGGAKWVNVLDKVGLPGPRWVATIETSRYVEGRAYVCFDAHRSDDDEPYIYVTEDFGQSWKSLRGNLPVGSSHVLREDMANQDVLYLGTEFAVWVSIDRGKVWTKLNSNLPTVAVHEFAQHPGGEMVAATHGRSLWILDVTPVRQLKAASLKAPVTLYQPATATRWRREPERITLYSDGSRRFVGENPPTGAQIYYSLTKKAEKASLKVLDYSGTAIRTLDVKTSPGLHVSRWDMSRTGGSLVGMAMEMVGPRRQGGGQAAFPGMYRVVLTVDGKEYSQGLRLQADPTTPPGGILAESDEEPVWSKKYKTKLDD